ncbi:tumor necrosis factor receptor superfamily member 11A [Menidia menidia]
MGTNFSTNWIFQGWITCVIVSLYAQNTASKSLQCEERQYLRRSMCCNKCKPGSYVSSHCNESRQTICSSCHENEYQPVWNQNNRCRLQKFCDPGKGFMKSPKNLLAEESCHCRPGLQCHPINCEYCEEIPTCGPGYGLEMESGSTNGRKECVPCKKGFFSADSNTEQCKQWTNCKAEGRNETKPGTSHSDAVCGPSFSGSTPSWAIVSVLSVITVLCLLILLLFCFKDKLKLLSVNLRSCVQNLKRTRIQQETLAPLYQSVAGGGITGGFGDLKCAPCEMTKLICQTPHGPENDPLRAFPESFSDVRVSLPPTEKTSGGDESGGKVVKEDQSEGSGEPEEVSEEEEEEVAGASPLLAVSCMCVVPVQEPLEVGENEDCSQAVSPGTLGTCSCGGLEGERDGEESKRPEGPDNAWPSATCVQSLSSLSSPLPTNPAPETCSPLSQAQERPQLGSELADRPPVKQEGLHRAARTDSAWTENGPASPVSPLMASASVGDLYLDKPPEAPGPGVSLGDGRENKLSVGDAELDCLPESLHSQLAEPPLTSGLVSGNNNTTFISSGQVMNFSGEVIVVYVSQGSHGGDEGEQDAAFGKPVQEEANETALFFQSCPRSQRDSVPHGTLQEETLPVQEAMQERLLEK